MRKFLFLTALAFATPAFAHDTISAHRMKELGDLAPAVCPVAHKMTGNMSDNVIALSGVQTIEEKVFILSLCKLYLHGKVDTLKGN